MKRIIIAFVIITLTCIMLSGCGSITEGEIYDKEFIEERSWIQIFPLVHTDGKTTSITMIPFYMHHPDEWVIRIKSLDGKHTASYYVTEEVYEECEIGMMFEYEKERGDLKEEPLEKKRK